MLKACFLLHRPVPSSSQSRLVRACVQLSQSNIDTYLGTKNHRVFNRTILTQHPCPPATMAIAEARKETGGSEEENMGTVDGELTSQERPVCTLHEYFFAFASLT